MPKVAEIILVGTFHFEHQQEILTDKELEIKELVNHLASFKPTKIAVEWERNNQEELSENYAKHNQVYAMDEIEQIGFRLAEELNHKEIFAINWAGQLTEEDMSKLNQSIQTEYPEVLKMVNTFSERDVDINPSISLLDSYKQLNDTELLKELEKMYLSFITVEYEGENVGTTFLHKWLERELMIVKHVTEILENPNERLLLLVGRDHLWMLRKLFEGKGWTVINPFVD